MTNLRLSWLGTPIIEGGAGVLHLETRKATALVAFLSDTFEPHSRESLAALFWSEFNQTRAYANLRRCLYSIHKVLGPGILVSDWENLRIDPNAVIWQDVSEFRLLLTTVRAHQHTEIAICPECINYLEKVIALYRGDFLEGFNLRDCPEFDDWQYMMREGFRLDLASSLEKLAHIYSAHGEWEKAILRTRQWVSLDRLNEAAQRMLMQVYALAGQRSAAIHQFEDCTRWLKDELGQSPNEETITLYQKILTGKTRQIGDRVETPALRSQVDPGKQPLIKRKFFIPQLRAGLVARPHLLSKLEQGVKNSLTLISAPAGYGKTTLLTEWIDALQKAESSSPWAVCWLSLDAGDNDLIRFLSYLTTALEKVQPGMGAETRALIRSFESMHPTTPLSMLVNDMHELDQSILLVLDDYQFINNPAIHDGITFLLEHIPDNVHILIATRSDPPIPLARLRARNQLTEIRAHDLRFTSIETAEFLNKVFNLALTPDQIATLENRTEGWIAGLQLAAISLQGRLDIAQFIEAFSGSHRFIMDYLAEEALGRQPTEIQAFLLQTSILEHLSEALCDFVITGGSENVIDGSRSSMDFGLIRSENQSQLVQLERSNLFIVPLDDERGWYRYHHLFADLLRTRLHHTSPELIPILHRRASTWFEKNGDIEESINHALAAKDWENSSRLIDRIIHSYLENGQMTTVMKWINGFPQDELFKYPKLCVQVAEVYSQAGMIDQIDPLLDRAEEIVSSMKYQEDVTKGARVLYLSSKEITVIRSMAAILRGLKAVCSDDPQRAVDITQAALVNIPDMEPKELAVLFWVQGWAYRSLGNLNLALELLTRGTKYARESGAILRDIWTDLGNVTRLVGKLPQAIDILTNSLQAAADRGIQNQGNLSRDESFLSYIYYEQNQLDLAFTHANRAIAHTQWWPSHNIISIAYASLAQILLAWNDLDGSLCAIEKAEQERKNRLMTPFVQSIVDVIWAQIWLRQGKWDLLDQWASDQISLLESKSEGGELIDEYLEIRLVMLVRVWIEKTKLDRTTERYEECLQLLDRLEKSCQTAGRVNSLAIILFLKDIILFSQGKIVEALNGLDKCFSIAEPGGYMRIFLDTGESGHALIYAYLQQSNPIHKLYAIQILKAFG
ncbi:MAG TPA: BTAD domain-containing putative transcriptional regulator, partial [Planococcus sp. (in: firmicutes)]|nr:BTAD domain-containing putative transcriptional regulator [Planococcus sp. (in: firmicutes)]